LLDIHFFHSGKLLINHLNTKKAEGLISAFLENLDFLLISLG
jgi:hypothetical protein